MEYENKCPICFGQMAEDTITIHEQCDEKNCKLWTHTFHKACINMWIKSCINIQVYPTCPECKEKIPIDKISDELRETAQTLLAEDEDEAAEDEEVAEDEVAEDEDDLIPDYIFTANSRLERIQTHDQIPFLGVMVCIDGRHILTISNLLLDLRIGSTIGQLKTNLLQHPDTIFRFDGLLRWKNIQHNLSPYNWYKWKYPEYRVTNIHHGVPSYTKDFRHLRSNYDLETDDVLLADIYRDYQSSVGYILENQETLENDDTEERSFEQKHFCELENVYYRTELRFNHPTGYDDPGYFDKAFVNKNNPFIPEDMRAYSYCPESTYYSLAWLVVHLDQI